MLVQGEHGAESVVVWSGATGGALGIAAQACLPCHEHRARCQLLGSCLLRLRGCWHRWSPWEGCLVPVKQSANLISSTLDYFFPCARVSISPASSVQVCIHRHWEHDARFLMKRLCNCLLNVRAVLQLLRLPPGMHEPAVAPEGISSSPAQSPWHLPQWTAAAECCASRQSPVWGQGNPYWNPGDPPPDTEPCSQ